MSEPKTSAVSIQQMEPTAIVKHAGAGFIAAGGTQEQFNKEAGFAIQMMRANNYLTTMDKQSIYDAIVNVALTGLTLNPELRLGYLIPFKGRLYFRSSYMGKKEILMRSGMVKDIWAEPVYEKDEFIINQGTERSIVHNLPAQPFADRGALVGGYWVAILTNGITSFGIMSKDEIDAIKKRSESVKSGKGSPWDTDYLEMFRKTLINRAYKTLPKTGISDNVLKVLEADGELDRQEITEIIEKETRQKFDPIEDEHPEIEEAEIVTDKLFPDGTQPKS